MAILKSRSPLWLAQIGPLSPPIFPLRNFPTLSHSQFTHSFPPHTQNGNFQIKIARAHSQSATLSKLPIFPISRKNH
ncbi:uncharacterized protein Gasu_62430 [Galdieria sulphuraria]|uniref:Uncharacterized protein n=1 Tax=Galdieria sulphuraria TaxID=130081 RepID=M2XRN7_GALSU|nr:uncharacterized protein Gasu_62430 [Galdieria sulphuraria]EME26109.1 hypothetical protein Gasu_62430 [Galdieria sulphuraria]|eukprot:XP_005702629.1 hypothetical protein Gasu_62430 [Galdieria sulphuraria]